ncbi:unnamed protein product [Amoebophrya sp. A25]|nr:unnamed protein product [Amoebophrya sp. A25]|eukprot:GSA25T00021559001.1
MGRDDAGQRHRCRTSHRRAMLQQRALDVAENLWRQKVQGCLYASMVVLMHVVQGVNAYRAAAAGGGPHIDPGGSSEGEDADDEFGPHVEQDLRADDLNERPHVFRSMNMATPTPPTGAASAASAYMGPPIQSDYPQNDMPHAWDSHMSAHLADLAVEQERQPQLYHTTGKPYWTRHPLADVEDIIVANRTDRYLTNLLNATAILIYRDLSFRRELVHLLRAYQGYALVGDSWATTLGADRLGVLHDPKRPRTFGTPSSGEKTAETRESAGLATSHAASQHPPEQGTRQSMRRLQGGRVGADETEESTSHSVSVDASGNPVDILEESWVVTTGSSFLDDTGGRVSSSAESSASVARGEKKAGLQSTTIAAAHEGLSDDDAAPSPTGDEAFLQIVVNENKVVIEEQVEQERMSEKTGAALGGSGSLTSKILRATSSRSAAFGRGPPRVAPAVQGLLPVSPPTAAFSFSPASRPSTSAPARALFSVFASRPRTFTEQDAHASATAEEFLAKLRSPPPPEDKSIAQMFEYYAKFVPRPTGSAAHAYTGFTNKYLSRIWTLDQITRRLYPIARDGVLLIFPEPPPPHVENPLEMPKVIAGDVEALHPRLRDVAPTPVQDWHAEATALLDNVVNYFHNNEEAPTVRKGIEAFVKKMREAVGTLRGEVADPASTAGTVGRHGSADNVDPLVNLIQSILCLNSDGEIGAGGGAVDNAQQTMYKFGIKCWALVGFGGSFTYSQLRADTQDAETQEQQAESSSAGGSHSDEGRNQLQYSLLKRSAASPSSYATYGAIARIANLAGTTAKVLSGLHDKRSKTPDSNERSLEFLAGLGDLEGIATTSVAAWNEESLLETGQDSKLFIRESTAMPQTGSGEKETPAAASLADLTEPIYLGLNLKDILRAIAKLDKPQTVLEPEEPAWPWPQQDQEASEHDTKGAEHYLVKRTLLIAVLEKGQLHGSAKEPVKYSQEWEDSATTFATNILRIVALATWLENSVCQVLLVMLQLTSFTQ